MEVSATDKIHPGQWIRITQHETDGSLGLELHGGHPLDGRCKLDSPGQRMLQWVVRVEDVIEGRIDIGRPLRVAVDPAWGAQIWASEPPVREVGIEHLTLEFPEREYGGHHHEQGLNGISLAAAFDSWVRDVAILNADNGVMLWYSKYCTVTELTLAGRGGHYGVNLAGAQDSLVTRFRIDTVFVHDLSVANLANGNVVSNGVGRRINFDHHRYAPYENLFSNIDVGTSARAARIWYSSDTLSGHYTAARETFWNLRPRVGLKYLPRWPEMNLIGPVKAKAVIDSHETGIWIEAVPDLRPLNLHASQRAKRLGRADSPPGLLPKSVPGYDGDSRPSRSPEWLYKSGLERE